MTSGLRQRRRPDFVPIFRFVQAAMFTCKGRKPKLLDKLCLTTIKVESRGDLGLEIYLGWERAQCGCFLEL
jgi:hypothetical protein